MSEFLRILENEVQLVALSFLVIVYLLRLRWIFKFNTSKENSFSAGNQKAGVVYSMMNVAMPWAMESTRKHPLFYVQFIIFHIGVVLAILATFIIPYWPELLKIKLIVWIFQGFFALALLIGLYRLYRRITHPSLRLISNVDDYFSIIMLILFLATGILAIPNQYNASELPLILFFIVTTFFLIYVPFSKICHYLYYPFSRYFLGKTMGHRGVMPRKKSDIDT